MLDMFCACATLMLIAAIILIPYGVTMIYFPNQMVLVERFDGGRLYYDGGSCKYDRFVNEICYSVTRSDLCSSRCTGNFPEGLGCLISGSVLFCIVLLLLINEIRCTVRKNRTRPVLVNSGDSIGLGVSETDGSHVIIVNP
jgi:hypothetical protein